MTATDDFLDEARCQRCLGLGVLEVLDAGRIHDHTCPDCHGSGWEPEPDQENDCA